MSKPKTRRRQLTDFQLDFIDDVVEFHIATREEAVEAFKGRDDIKIDGWKESVYAGRDNRRHARQARKDAEYDVWRPTGQTLPCAACSRLVVQEECLNPPLGVPSLRPIEVVQIRFFVVDKSCPSQSEYEGDIGIFACCDQCRSKIIERLKESEVVDGVGTPHLFVR